MWTFISKYKNYSIQVTVGSEKRRVDFRDIGQYPQALAGCGVFSTNDEALTDAIKAHPKYAGDYEQIVPGKDFTGTDEGPQVTWGDSSELPITLPSKANLYKLVYPDDGSQYSTGDLQGGDMIYDGSELNIIGFDGLTKKIMMSADAIVPEVMIIKSIPYEESSGIGFAQNIPLSNFQFPDGISFYQYCVQAVIIENLGGSTVSSINVMFSNAMMSGLSVEAGEKRVFMPTSQRLLDYINSGAGNSAVAISRPVSSIPLRYTVLLMCFRNL